KRVKGYLPMFQSQARCQAPGDRHRSTEKARGASSFNLRRDARPLATLCEVHRALIFRVFQSQARCQAPGDLTWLELLLVHLEVSISGEMPGPWRLRLVTSQLYHRDL